MADMARVGVGGFVATLFHTEDGDGAVIIGDGLVREVLLPALGTETSSILEEKGIPSVVSAIGIRAAGLLEAYWRGEVVSFDLPLLLPREGTFRRRVLEEVARIPCGTVRTYGEIAALCGSPGAARAVGAVMSRNRLPIIIPCHRVVGSTGAMVGFTAAGGLPYKARLLVREGVSLGADGRVDVADLNRKNGGL